MSSSISSAQSNNRAGLCPHGLPPAACPICSSGAGAVKQVNMNDKPVTKPKSPAQWSFMKCYAVGLSMRAKEKRLQNIKNAFEQQVEFAKKLSNIIQNMADKFHTAIKNIQDNSPVFIYNTLQIITKLIIKPAFALISLIPLLIEKMAKFEQKMSVMINQAGEKLVSI
ncbi:MAG: hypothetical protein LUH05_07120, partial [Candidatus Gastranaerophilales bacterium]|nr:hypothetical protein [Candidatus Gastranaerophilales bacterium]